MQFKASFIATFILAASPALGFTVPPGTPDGVYLAMRDSSGQEHHIRQEPNPAERPVPARAPSRVTKRYGLDEVGCFGDQIALNPGNCDAAVAAVKAQMGGSGTAVGSHRSLYSISGTVVAYCCNNRVEGNTCFADIDAQANSLITARCGLYEPGYAYDSGAHLTYGYAQVGYNFCPES